MAKSDVMRFGEEYSNIAKIEDKQAWIKNRRELLKEQDKLDKKAIEELDAFERRLKKEAQAEEHDRDLEYQREMHEQRLKDLRDQGNYLKAATEEASDAFKDKINKVKEDINSGVLFSNLASGLSSKLDPIINKYLESQTAISAHLSGSNSSLAAITDKLHDTLSTSTLVKQEAVYNNLSQLVQSGITYNVEQRAFLQTLSEDMNLQFGANGNLARLIRLTQQDSTANRLALEYNLQKYLNESYQNSQYIVDKFVEVSDALFEMRALNAGTGAGVENTLQTWLGALYSNGLSGNTASSLATAFNALGSGDISQLGQGISNLVLMGVARAGLDYGDILNSGLNANQTNQIMSGISTYLQEMGANSSNVVKSQLANIFGVNVADIIAANNTGVVNTTMNDNISTLLGDYSGFVSMPTQMMNLFDNMLYTWGTNVASSPLALGSYKIMELIAPTLSSLVGGSSTLIGNLVAASPSIPLLLSLIPTLGDFGSSISNLYLGTNNQLSGILSALGGIGNSTTVKVSGGGTSASAYIGNGDMSGMFSNTKSSALDIADTFNIEGIKQEWEDNVQLLAENSVLMLGIMEETMHDMKEDINTISMDLSALSLAYQTVSSLASGVTSMLGG